MLDYLLRVSHELPPDELAGAVAAAAPLLGAGDVAVYLVDYEQVMLMPLPDGSGRPPLEIDTTLAGRSFTASTVNEGDGDPGRRLLDGTDRLGVLALTLDTPRVDDDLRARCVDLASVVAELLVSKGRYTDAFTLVRRRREMSVAAEMQWQLLPPLTFLTPRVSIAGLLEPAYEVGGDAFDYALNGRVARLAIVDPVGHDLTASTLASVAIG